MRGRAWTLLLCVAFLLSGCLEDSSDPGQDPSMDDGPDDDGTTEAPEWSLGDHWNYESPTGTFTLVASGEQGGDWILDSTSPDLALFDAMFDISYVGPISKTDISGQQDGTRVKFFDFPLEDGKQWSTTWDGESVSVTATLEEDGRYRMEGVTSSGPHVEYVYDPEVGFFREATWYGGDPDGEDWYMRLSGSGEGFSGTLHRYTIGETHSFVHEVDGTGLYEAEFGEDWNELAFTTLLICGGDEAGQIAVGIDDPQSAEEDPLPMFPMVNDPAYGDSLDCAQSQFTSTNWTAENPGGTWEIGFIVGAPNAIAHLFITERRHDEIAFP